ncbi:DUF262 domain-containing protein [Fusibacter bizertensis]
MLETFKAQERTVSYLLTDNKKYTIPRNQREYVWDKDNLEDLWDDIFRTIEIAANKIIKSREYFIGSCVIMLDKKNNREILDGQQRLTTLIIFLSAIAQKFKEIGDNKLFESTYNYIQPIDKYGDEYFVIENPSLNPYFAERILYKEQDIELTPENEEQSRIEFAYNFFCKKIDELINLEVDLKIMLTTLRDKIVDLKIVEIIVATEVDGYTVFEILNARGKELELHDLIKNWCMRIKPNNYTIDKVKTKWNKIIKNVEASTTSKNSFRIFINHYYIARYEKFKDDRDIYKRTKKEIRNETLDSYLESLIINSNNYAYFSKPVLEKCFSVEEFKYLNFFKVFRITQIRPILLSLYKNYYDGVIKEAQLVKYLKRLYNFHSIYTGICKRPTNVLEGIYNFHSPKLYNDFSKDSFDSLMKELRKVTPIYNDFERDFILKKYSNKNNDFSIHKRAINLIISDVELYILDSDELQINRYTIEHILSDQGDSVTGEIGNLIPLAKKINEKAENFELKNKILFYNKSKFASVKEFIKNHGEKEIWTKDNIENRSKALSRLCYEKIWSDI